MPSVLTTADVGQQIEVNVRKNGQVSNVWKKRKFLGFSSDNAQVIYERVSRTGTAVVDSVANDTSRVRKVAPPNVAVTAADIGRDVEVNVRKNGVVSGVWRKRKLLAFSSGGSQVGSQAVYQRRSGVVDSCPLVTDRVRRVQA